MISFNADHHFHIGQAHLNQGKPCQDYALSGLLDGAAFALVADGCSSGGHTETGAQILAHAAAKVIREHWAMKKGIDKLAHQEIDLKILITAIQAGGVIGLNIRDMLATTGMIYLSPEGGFVHLMGDGVIAYKKRGEDVIEMHRFDWEDNVPFYPVYAQDPRTFIKAHGGDLQAKRMVHQAVWYDGSEYQRSAQITEVTLADGMCGSTHYLSAEEVAELEFVAVFTDGATQFKKTEWADIVHTLMGFKGIAGVFVKRCLGYVVKNAVRSGNEPLDDIGMAVVHVMQTPDTEQAS